MNRLYDAIYELCISHGISGGKLCAEIGIQRSLLTDLKMGRKQSLSTETLKKIADYFGVSIDYLLTGEETEKAASSQADDLSFDDFTYAMYNESKELTDKDKALLLALAREMKEANEKKE